MNRWLGWRKIRYESELDPGFSDEITSIPGGEQLFKCIQCGTCSGMCPLSPYMDYTPRQIIAMIRAGFRGEVLSCYTTWLCASCYSSTVECPKEIKITDLMYAAKRSAIRRGVYPKKFPIPILAREFFRGVERNGRSSEGWLLINLFLKTNPFLLFKQMGLGWGLWRHGRLSLRHEAIKRKGELQSMLQTLEREQTIKDKNPLVRAGEVHS